MYPFIQLVPLLTLTCTATEYKEKKNEMKSSTYTGTHIKCAIAMCFIGIRGGNVYRMYRMQPNGTQLYELYTKRSCIHS